MHELLSARLAPPVEVHVKCILPHATDEVELSICNPMIKKTCKCVNRTYIPSKTHP